MNFVPLGQTDVRVPPIIFGTSCLGNLYHALDYETKLEIIREIFNQVEKPAVLDTAGKYGAGLALEVIGNCLRDLGIENEEVIISNKLGWYRTALTTSEPTYEKGVWMDLQHDATQKISGKGIIECWNQGCELLGNEYIPQVVSVHDPDEYLAQAETNGERKRIFGNILDAYTSLLELKQQGHTQAVGVGVKDWRVIKEITDQIDLDWVMLAVSFTVYSHPVEILDFMDELHERGISIINSAVFHAGFLTGGQYYDYRLLDESKEGDRPYFLWRDKFFNLCNQFEVLPAEACVQFGMSHPGVCSIALNTSRPGRITQNVNSVQANIPGDFWTVLKEARLISSDYPYL